jgi:hypothetical protein
MNQEHYINNLNYFIKGWYIDKELCNNLIAVFESKKDKQRPGTIFGGGVSKIKKNVKDSMDVSLNPGDVSLNKYIPELLNVMKLYGQFFKASDEMQAPFGIVENINIQRYYPGQGFHKFHFEKNPSSKKTLSRHLVFMTYLNDVIEGGETEFYHQKLKIKPEQGLTLIWPTDWTYLHKGCSSEHTKYIVTGWFNFLPLF